MRLIPLAAVVFAATLHAQDPQEIPPAGPDMSPAEIQKIFDGYLIIQAQDALGLSEQQFAQVVPRLKALQDTRRRYQQERFRLLGDLQRITRQAGARGVSAADDAILKERLSALQENESRSAAEIRKAYNALDEVLDVRQQARFRVFEEAIERKKVDLLIRARQNQNRPGNPNRPNPNRPNLKRPPPVLQ